MLFSCRAVVVAVVLPVKLYDSRGLPPFTTVPLVLTVSCVLSSLHRCPAGEAV
jgi:hypothetical protein